MIIDARHKVLGRLASDVAQRLKDGDDVEIINAEKAIVSGDREEVFDRYRAKRKRGSRDHGPYYPKAPERIVKRTIKGMLPDSQDGRDAFKRLRTYRGNPEDWEADDHEVKTAADLKHREYVSIEEISDHI